MDSNKLDYMKQNFYNRLEILLSRKAINACFLSRQKYFELIEEIKELKVKTRGKTSNEYQKLKRYDVLKIGDVDKLIYPVTDNLSIRYYVATDELFDIIHETHIKVGHGGRDRTARELNTKYKNITAETIMIYLEVCEDCLYKGNIYKKAQLITSSQQHNNLAQQYLIPNSEENETDASLLEVNNSSLPNSQTNRNISSNYNFVQEFENTYIKQEYTYNEYDNSGNISPASSNFNESVDNNLESQTKLSENNLNSRPRRRKYFRFQNITKARLELIKLQHKYITEEHRKKQTLLDLQIEYEKYKLELTKLDVDKKRLELEIRKKMLD